MTVQYTIDSRTLEIVEQIVLKRPSEIGRIDSLEKGAEVENGRKDFGFIVKEIRLGQGRDTNRS